VAAIASSHDTTRSAVLLYDGDCAFCCKSVGILRRLDWLRRIQYQNCRDTARLPDSKTPLVPAQLLEQMHLVAPDRERVYRGFAAFQWMACRLPLLWAIFPLLYIPGVPNVGQRIYLWIARNRFQLVPCEHGACNVPARKAANQ